MAYVVRMPKLGMEMQEGVLLEWKVEEGDGVDEDAVLAEIESEKSVHDVPARESGVLRRRLLPEGAEVSPGTPMGIVAGESEPIDGLLASTGDDETPDSTGTGETPATAGADGMATDESETGPVAATSGGSSAAPEKVSPRARKRAEELGVDLDGIEGSGVDGSVIEADVERIAESTSAPPAADESPARAADVKATPDAQHRARELDVPLAAVEGRGPAGTIRAADVEEFAAAEPDATAPAGAESGEKGPATRTVASEEPFSGMRRTIADRLTTSWREVPHVTVSRDVPVDHALDAAAAADDGLDVDVSVVDVLLLALSETLDAHPEFNATVEDGVHRIYEEHNVAIAIDVDDGLVTPVLDRVNERLLPDLATRRLELTEKTLDGDYTMDDARGGTFTVSNLGVLGVDAFTPIINPPQVAILGVNRVREAPVPATDRESGVDFERRMRLDLSFDHRAVDGADAARFLETLEEQLTDPWGVLLSRA